MRIRPATIDDLPAITQIYNEAIEDRNATCDLIPQHHEDRTGWFAQFDDRHPIFVGEAGGSVVAYGCFYPYSHKPGYRHSVEHSVYVARSARGQKRGRQMLEYLIEQAKRLGYHYMEGRVFVHNEVSIALHHALGFEIMGIKREVANLDGQWRDVALLVKLL